MSARYGIRRSDGQWYIGTVDHNSVFGTAPHVASYDTEERAAKRMQGLARTEQRGRTFEILPVGDFHAD